ncbi:MAG: hypothetical protein BWY36_00905 [Candidatus Diapherotrites archaeon ADurb.Bin253]|nr:MAG: hypothetical protein BWY36_00905 [Candidatus Diapherotrites archaeon ADurb.Bin253]
MKKFVCESLFDFYLNENASQAKKLFADASIGPQESLYKSFFDTFSEVPEFQGKFAELILDPESDLEEMEKSILSIYNAIKDFKSRGFKIDFDINSIKTIGQLGDKLRESIKNQKKNLSSPIVPEGTAKEEKFSEKEEERNENQEKEVTNILRKKEDPTLFGFRLWLYAVLIRYNGVPYVKFGETYREKEEDAIKYVMSHTFGKLRGLMKKGDIIFCKDVTEEARKINDRFVYKKHQQFDDFLRNKMPGKSGSIKNEMDLGSDELHEHNPKETDSEIKKEWNESLEKALTGKIQMKEAYAAREFHEEMNEKLLTNKPDKYLLGAATGSGKETMTLATIITIHDDQRDLFDENTVHVSCATIPSTELELFEELSLVPGINTKKGFIDFSRIIPYCTDGFANTYKKDLKENAKIWFEKRVTIISSSKQIPKHSDPKYVPILFGSFQDIGLKSTDDPKGRYKELGDRIGILSIGEGHQFLSNVENRLWKSIKDKYHFKFFLLITGTPYDFIFNESGHLYFGPEERTLFTRNDLYEAKRAGDKDFQKYPTFNYYSLDLAKEIEKIKEEEGEYWVGEEGFTYEKLFERKNGKFKYQELIISIFKRFFSIDKKGNPDQLSILEAKDLCEEAKKHVLVALPTGTKDSPAGEYITDLKNLLEENGALGNYTPIAAYEDDLGEIKEKVDEEKGKTITFTCRKLLTGTNIPKWGSLVFLRPIGSSIKFFEQATGRIGRPSKGKTNVGVFLGNIDNIVSLHVSADEKILSNRGESQEYNYIIKRTYDNYNFFGVKGGKWQKLDMPDLVEAVERASMNADYGINLCLNNPKAPEDFNLEFKAPSGAGREEVEVTSQGNLEAKNKRTVERTKQLAIEFEEAKDKDKWYKDMIKTHIPKIVMICLLRNISTIQEFEKEIKRALQENDETLLDMIGKGVDMIPLYIGDDKQIDRSFINRWIDKNNRLTSEKSGEEGFKQRYDVINNKMDIKKLSESIVFDPIKLTDEICEKIKDPLKKADKIMAIEKNGAFTYSILKEIGFENANKLTLIILEPLSEEIIHYIFGENEKLPEIKFIKDINDIENMPQVDIVVGNWPFQKAEGKHKLYPKFTNIAFSVTKPDGYVAFISPKPVIEMLLGRTASQVSFDHGFKEIKYLAIDTPKRYFDVGSSFCYCIVQNTDCNKTNAQVEYYNDKNVIETSSIDLYSGMFLPIPPTKFNVSLVKRVINNKNEFNRSVSRVSLNRKFLKEEGKYEVIEKINKTEGIIRKYTDILHKDAFKDKVIFGVSGDGYLKVKASQGIAIGSPACCYVVTNSEQQSDNLIKFSKHPLVTYIMVNLFDLYQNKNYYFLQWFKKFPLDLDPTDENICENYDITLKEMEYIKKNARFNK